MPLLIASAMAIMTACSTKECYENRNSLPLAGFYSSSEEPEAISLNSITIAGIGAPGDSLLHDKASSLSETYLPFRIDSPETSYAIRYTGADYGNLNLADTITFRYKIIPWFISEECGATFKFEIENIETTHTFIDSVTCPTGIIDNINTQNLRIYFRVDDGDND